VTDANPSPARVAIVTREWPPEIYGGAGVHVEYLVEHLRELVAVDVHAFGEPKAGATSYPTPEGFADANGAVRTMATDLAIVDALTEATVVHSHTWYANFAGHTASLLHGIPHVLTAHSLEPRRPWKAEQLGGGYRLSSWIEKTAYEAADAVIAVSDGMRADVLDCYPDVDPARVHVVRNGIDTERYSPNTNTDVLERLGISMEQPFVLFVGRITRQKGIVHLLAAAERLPAGVALVLCASAPDTPEIGAETAAAVARLTELRAAQGAAVHWIAEQLPREQLVQLLTHAAVFACPSVYEPLGIVNLEAMACGTAVVASAVGGIPEVVVHGETGLLVDYDSNDPRGFEAAFGDALSEVLADPARAEAMGTAGRARAVESFGWDVVARDTLAVYQAAAEVFRRRSEHSTP